MTATRTPPRARLDDTPIDADTVKGWAAVLVGHLVAPDRRRLDRALWAAPLAAIVAGVAVAFGGGPIGLAAVGMIALAVLVWNHPPVAGYTMVAVAPMIVGFGRDQVLPLVRPNEALLFALCGLLSVRWLVYSRRARFRFNRVDWAIVAIVACGFFVPLTAQLIRLRPLSTEDFFYSLVFLRIGLLYALVRCTIRTAGQVRASVGFSLATASFLGILGLMDSLNLFNAAEYLNPYFPNEGFIVNDGRGAASIGNPIGFGVYSAMNALIAIAFLLAGERPKRALGLAAVMTTLGVFGSGQIGPVVSFLAGLAALAIVTKSVRRLIVMSLPVLLVAGFAVAPLAQRRLQGFDGAAITSAERNDVQNLPNEDRGRALFEMNPGSSWDVRLYNLETYFVPKFDDVNNIIWGVSPQARVVSPRKGEDFIWIESGHLWLLWSGGIPLFLAWFGLIGMGMVTARRVLRTTPGPVGAVGAGVFGALMTVNLAQTFDPHITLRGSADILYPLLALVTVGWTVTTNRSRS